MHRYTLLSFLVIGFILNAKIALAQSSDSGDDRDLDQIEAEIKKNEPAITPPPSMNPVNQNNNNSAAPTEKEAAPPEIKVDTLSDLSKLQPFSEVSVLQRRYMPKSGRVQFFGGLSDMVNDPWNSTAGLNVRLGYHFTEAWGLEIADYLLGSSPTQAATNLLSQNNVNAQSLGSATGFIGGYINWTPIYGKMSFGTKKIVPFDMYFNLGGGSTSLNSIAATSTSQAVPSSASGISFGTGQIYAITRSVGFRWDLTWNTYSIPAGSINNLLLTLGANWYFPEATYR